MYFQQSLLDLRPRYWMLKRPITDLMKARAILGKEQSSISTWKSLPQNPPGGGGGNSCDYLNSELIGLRKESPNVKLITF